jgi:hypothetical protein
MKYTIDLSTGKYEEYRLRVDNTWRKLGKGWAVEDGDLVISEPESIKRYSRQGILELDGKTCYANPDIIRAFDFESGDVFTFPRIHREKNEKPALFSRSDIRKVIEEGDDSRFNVLTLDIYGRFALQEFEDYDRQWDPYIAVCHEASCPGNDYVGIRASKDKRMIEMDYLDSLGGWLEHLKTGKLNRLVSGEYTGKSESELIRQINEINGQ